MDLVTTDAEVAEAERIYKTAYDADFGRGYGMRRALESFLQGRAKPAQEEITDEQIISAAHSVGVSTMGREWDLCCVARAAIRASKGEKT